MIDNICDGEIYQFFFFIKEEKIRETFNFLMEYRHNYDNSLINYKTPWKMIFRCRMMRWKSSIRRSIA